MPKTRSIKGKVTTRGAWTDFRNRNSDSSGSSRGSSRRGSSPDHDYQFSAQDDIVNDINTRFAKSNMDGEEGYESLLRLMGNNTPPTVSPIGPPSITSYENIVELEKSNESIYHFCTNVCKFPLEMTRLFKKNLTLQNGKRIFLDAMKQLLSGFLLLYKVIGSAITYRYAILVIFVLLYSIDFTRPFVKYMLEILVGWIYFGMEKSGLNNQISIFIEFVKEKTKQLFQLIMLEYATPALTEISTNAVNRILTSSTFQSKVADAAENAMQVAITSPRLQNTIQNAVTSTMNSPAVQLAITGAFAKEAIPAIKHHYQLLDLKIHSISASLTGMRGQMDNNSVKLINKLKEIDLRNIDNNEGLHQHIEDQSKKMINNNAMYNTLGSLPQITNMASIALENFMGRNVRGQYLLRNEGGRQTRRRAK